MWRKYVIQIVLFIGLFRNGESGEKKFKKLELSDGLVRGFPSPVQTWRGFSPFKRPSRYDNGCHLQHIGASGLTIGGPKMGRTAACRKGCTADSTCVAFIWFKAVSMCSMLSDFQFSNQYAENIMFRDCREHLCYQTCHCNDGASREAPARCLTSSPLGRGLTTVLDERHARAIYEDSFKKYIVTNSAAQEAQHSGIWIDEASKPWIEVVIMISLKIFSLPQGTFDGMAALQYLNLDDNELDNVEGLFNSLSQLKALMLNNNRIRHLTANTFRGLGELEYLDLSGNLFTSVGPQVFAGLTHLRTLHLKPYHNLLNIAKGAFDDLKSLSFLTLTGGPSDTSYDLALIEALPKLAQITIPPTFNPGRFETPREEFSTNNCDDGNCYRECLLLKPMNDDLNNVHYDFFLNLANLYTERGRHTFITQTAYLKEGDTLMIPERSKLDIYARELIIEGDVLSVTDTHTTTPACMIRPVHFTDGRRMYRFIHAALDVLAIKIHIKAGSIHAGKCTFGDIERNGVRGGIIQPFPMGNLPEFLDDFAEATIKCAELFSYTEDRLQLSIEMLASVKRMYKVRGKAKIVRAMMMKANIEENTISPDGPFFVPHRSLSVAHRDYVAWAEHASYTLDEYERLKDRDESAGTWETMYDVMTNMTTKLTQFSDLMRENAKKELQIAERGVAKIREKFSAQMDLVKSKQRAVNDAIEAQKAEAELENARGMLSGFMSLFTAVRTMNPFAIFSAAEAVYDGYQDHKDNIETLTGVADACKGVLDMLESGTMDVESVDVYLKDLEKASDLKVKLVEWDQMAPQINNALRQAGIENDAEVSDFELAVSQLAGWGRKLTEEIIAQANLVRRVGEKVAMAEARHEQTEITQAASDRTSYRKQGHYVALQQIKKGVMDEKLTLLGMQKLYCQSYKHYYLRDCDPTMRPNIREPLRVLIQKSIGSKGMEIEGLLNTMRQPPHHYEETLFLDDKVSEDCVSEHDCPVTAFKKSHSVSFNIPLDSHLFLTNDRVRVEEVDIKFDGIEGNGAYTVSMKSEPFFSDRLGTKEFEFYSVPRVFNFKYNIRTDRVQASGAIHDEYEHLFTEITPFTEWILSYDPRYNRGIYFSGVTSIHITFRGSAISNLGFKRRK